MNAFNTLSVAAASESHQNRTPQVSSPKERPGPHIKSRDHFRIISGGSSLPPREFSAESTPRSPPWPKERLLVTSPERKKPSVVVAASTPQADQPSTCIRITWGVA